MFQCLTGFEIKNDSAFGGPVVVTVGEDRRSAAEVAHRFDVFHIAAGDGFEADGDAGEGVEFAVGAVGGEELGVVQFAVFPAEAAGFAGGVGGG